MPTQKTCERCGYMSSNLLCKACLLLEGLNRGLPQMGIGKESKAVSFYYFCLLFGPKLMNLSFYSAVKKEKRMHLKIKIEQQQQ
jgi:hypothetical protein